MICRRNAEVRGFTLVEVLVSTTVLSVIIVTGLSFLSAQTRLFATSVERTTALTRARYVAHTLQREVRTLGSNLVAGQPGLIYAGEDVIAFNADYASNVVGDVFAVYVDPNVPAGQVSALDAPLTIPGSSFPYGSVVYTDGAGGPGAAELLVFWFARDTITAEPDDFVLYRQVNGAPAEPVSEGIRRLDGMPFFQYWTAAPEEVAGGSFSSLADTMLPVAHSEPYHLSPADTGVSATVDSIRAVGLRFSVWPSEDTTAVPPLDVNRIIALPNAGVRPVMSCGSSPILGSSLVATVVVSATDPPMAELSWSPAVDDAGGEGDVVRYVVWRRELPAIDWGDPLVSLPAGSATYSYTDPSIASGRAYEYALAAQDCTPTLSTMATSGIVVVP